MSTYTKERRRQRHEFDSVIKQDLKRLAQKPDNWHGPLALLENTLVIAGAAALGTATPWAYPVSIALIGTRQRALATLLHEGSHYTLCGSRMLSRLIGMVSGWAVFQAFHRYRQSHGMEHHVHLGDESRDPDTINYVRQGLFEADPRSFFRKHLLPLALGFKTVSNVKNLVRDRLLPRSWKSLEREQKVEYVLFVAFWMAIITACGWAGILPQLVLYWLVPYLTVFQGVNWLIELAEHFPLTRIFENELEMTRNRRGGLVENAFFGIHGENWHLVHHLYPGIPFWRLAEAHRTMMRDPVYRRANSRSGGLLARGPAGEQSIVALMNEQLLTAKEHEGASA